MTITRLTLEYTIAGVRTQRPVMRKTEKIDFSDYRIEYYDRDGVVGRAINSQEIAISNYLEALGDAMQSPIEPCILRPS